MATTWFVRLSRALYTTLRVYNHNGGAASAGHVSVFTAVSPLLRATYP